MDSIELKAYAKINLGLDVLGRRENGYHDVRMVMQTIDLHDTLRLTRSDRPKITLESSGVDLPGGPENLVYQAIQLMREEFSIREGVTAELKKEIPVAAGMAGGSTDAAAALRGMNELFQLHLSEAELMERGVKIGADVPFCIMQGTALSEGIGERLTRIRTMPECVILIAKPGIMVSTKYVYEHLVLDDRTHHPDIDGLLLGIQSQDLMKMADSMGNLLESVTEKEYPVITEIKNRMLQYGAVSALMSGSGPTVFGLYKEKETAQTALNRLKESDLLEVALLTKAHP